MIDASASFAHGQTYVALSRCKTLEGVVLSAPLSAKAVISDHAVDTFTMEARRNEPDEKRFRSLQQTYFLELLSGLFDFQPMEQALRRYVRLIDEHLYKLFPKQLAACKEEVERFHDKVTKVAQKFGIQYTRLIDTAQDYAADPTLQGRIHSAATYFQEQLQPLDAVMASTVTSDNKELKKKLRDAMEELEAMFDLKTDLLDYVLENGFHVAGYLKQKALLSIDDSASQRVKAKGEVLLPKKGREAVSRLIRERPRERKRDAAAVEVPTDVLHPELYTVGNMAQCRSFRIRAARIHRHSAEGNSRHQQSASFG